jgi:hypothetical protein
MQLAASLVSVWLLALGADGGFSAPSVEGLEAYEPCPRLAEPVATLCMAGACLEVAPPAPVVAAATLQLDPSSIEDGLVLCVRLAITCVEPSLRDPPATIRAWRPDDERRHRRWRARARPVWLLLRLSP